MYNQHAAGLQVCDAEFKPDLTDKICQLVQRFAPEKRWQIDSLLQARLSNAHDQADEMNLQNCRHALSQRQMFIALICTMQGQEHKLRSRLTPCVPCPWQVMTQAGAAVKEEAVRALIVLISNAPDLHGYAVRVFYTALRTHLDKAEFALVMASTWLIGAFLSLVRVAQLLAPGNQQSMTVNEPGTESMPEP
jgi:hypothetical protein